MTENLMTGLSSVKNLILKMGSLAENMIAISIQNLVDRRDEPETIYSKENEVNSLQIEIDEKVITVIALHQPVAKDLRFLIMATKIAGELERLADQAVNIAQHTSFLLKHPQLKPLVDLPIMADTAKTMLKESLDSLMKQDLTLARHVLDTDDKVDALKDQIFRELLTYMMSDTSTVPRALALILISRSLERIGDHATNIAEEVIFLVKGKDIRHHHEEQRREQTS